MSESLEAWAYDPVVPVVYHEYKHSGSSRITLSDTEELKIKDELIQKFLGKIHEIYSSIRAVDLVDWTHTEPA